MSRLRRAIAAIAAAVVIAGAVSGARAQDATAAAVRAQARGPAGAIHREGLAMLEIGMHGRHVAASPSTGAPAYDGFGISPRLDLRVPLFGRLGFDLRWSVPWANVSPDGREAASRIRLGNPYLGGDLQWGWPAARLRTGLGVVLPFASTGPAVDSDPADFASHRARHEALESAVIARGAWEGWLWRREAAGLVAPARFDAILGGNVTLELEGALALLTASHGTFDLYGELAAAGGWIVGPVVPGLRLALVSGVPNDEDEAQLSVEPFARVVAGAYEGRAGLVISLPGPIGPEWGVRVAGGVTW